MGYKEIESKLNECDNIHDMFNVLNGYYDLKNTKLGFVAKSAFIKGIVQGLKMINPNKK